MVVYLFQGIDSAVAYPLNFIDGAESSLSNFGERHEAA